MSQSIHASHDDLLDLIHGDGDTAKARWIGEHIHCCQECRSLLDALTAQSAIWKKTPIHLRHADDRGMFPSAFLQEASPLQEKGPETAELCQEASGDPIWEYPIQELLDRPKHPEMMGRIGKYDVEREVGRGGMGVVLKAHDAELNRPVAIKILAPHLASHATARRRFAQEAIAAAGVLHPNVIAVHGVSNEGKTPYIVMPFIDGPSLQTLVEKNGPLTEIEIIRIALQIASGLAAAHSQGLVHRDIKPANILIESGVQRVMITDFGLARAEDDASLTRTGWLTGTPNYMSPEQTRGQRADHRSDLFSLGSLLYFLSTGRLPFRAETPLGVLHRIQNDQPTPVRQVNHLISKTLSDLIAALLEKSPQDRFQTAGELHELLEKYLAYLHQPEHSKPPKVMAKREQSRNRRQLAIVAVVVVATLSSMAMGYSGVFSDPYSGNQVISPPFFRQAKLGGPKSSSASLGVPEEVAENAEALVDAESSKKKKKASKVLDDSPSPAKLFAEALCLYQLDRMEESLSAFRITATFEEFKAKSHYNIACIRAKQGDAERAFTSLERAIEAGFIDQPLFQSDEDLNGLRGDPRFAKLEARRCWVGPSMK